MLLNATGAGRAFALLLLILLQGCDSKDTQDNANSSAHHRASAPKASVSSQPVSLDPKDYQDMDFFVADISERTFDEGPAIAVTFSIPLDASDSFSDYLSVENDDGEVDGGWVLSKSRKTAYFEHIETGEKYRVRVNKQVPTITGATLKYNHSEILNIREAAPSFSFASKDRLLPLNLHSGLPVVTYNVPEVNVDFHHVSPEKIARVVDILGDRNQLHNYSLREAVKPANYVYSGRFTLTEEKNKRRTVNLPLNTIQALQKPGLYLAIMSLPGKYESEFKVTYFMVTDIGLQAKKYGKDLHLVSNSLTTSEPLEDVDIKVYNYKGTQLHKGKTNGLGVLDIKGLKSSARYVVARHQNSVSVLNLKGAALDLSDFQTAQRLQAHFEVFLYSERDLYRPGDTVNFNGLLRNYDGQLGKLVPLKAKLRSGDGKLVKEFSWTPNDQGYYHYAHHIDKNATLGNWVLEIRGLDKGVTEYRFKVEEFIPERLKLTFNPENQPQVFHQGTPIKVSVQGDYLYGAPAAGNRFDANVSVAVDRTPFEAFAKYAFGDEGELKWNTQFDLNKRTLSDAGQANFTIPNRWQGATTPLRLKMLGSLYETGGRPTSRYHTLHWVPDHALIGIRPNFEGKTEQNDFAEFEVIKTDGTKVLALNQDIEVKLVRKDRKYYWEYNDREGWHYEYTESDYVVAALEQKLENGMTSLSLPVEYGHYRLEVTDPKNKLKTTYSFQAGEDWYSWWREANEGTRLIRPDKVNLALDKAAYRQGDVARLSLVPPSAGHAIVSVESDQLLWQTRVDVAESGAEVEIPIDAAWDRHDIYVSVTHLQAMDGSEQVTANRAMGLVHLPLDRSDRRIEVDIDAPEAWLPNQDVEVTLNLTGHNNAALQQGVWVTLAAVDMGILNITDYQTPDPEAYFFSPRRYQVDTLDMYNEIIELNQNRLAKQRFGGDAGALSRGGDKAQSDVQIVSLFSGLTKVEGGKVTIPLSLPDFNGRLKLMAVAFGENNFGHADAQVTVAAPLVTQLALPRFVAWGDKSSLALDLNNLSGEAQTVSVTLAATPPVLMEDKIKLVTLKDKEKQTLVYPFDVARSGTQSKISLMVEGVEGYDIEREWKLNARSAYPAVTHRVSSQLSEGESLVLASDAFDGYQSDTLAMSVQASNVVDLQLRDQLHGLLTYPYGCLEQTTSSTYPWLYANSHFLDKLAINGSQYGSAADNVSKGIDRLLKKQKSNGAFGLWSSDSGPEEHWLTVYVADFLMEANQKGFVVGQNFYASVMDRIGYYLRSSYSYDKRWTEDPKHYKFAYRAYAGYVLSQANKAKLSQLRSLAKDKANAKSQLPLIHLAIALKNQGDHRLAKEVYRFAASQPLRSKGYLGDYGSDIRDGAMIVKLLLKHDFNQDAVLNRTLALAELIRARQYLSTQERNALLMAGVELDKSSGKTWSAALAVGKALDEIEAEGNFTRFYSGRELTKGMTLTNTSSEDVFASVSYMGYRMSPPKPERSLGLKVSRDYFNRQGRKISPSSMAVGDMVLVRVRVESDQKRPDLMVVDLLPAGLELENENLASGAQASDWIIQGRTLAEREGKTTILHREYRDDRFVAALSLRRKQKAEIFYLARAVTPGTYLNPAPFVEDMYDPEVYGIGQTPSTLVIKAQQ